MPYSTNPSTNPSSNASVPERFDLRQIAPQPWRNGAGLTREIAVARNTASECGFDWRLSVAEVACDAPFSAFPGVDRCIVLLRGAGLQLGADADADARTAALDHRLDTPFVPFQFPRRFTPARHAARRPQQRLQRDGPPWCVARRGGLPSRRG